MKHIISLLTLFLCCTSLHAQDRVVEQPAFEVRNTNTLEFQKIILNDTATIMYVDAYYRPKYWIKIVDETTLEANGKSYRIKAGDGIKLNEEFWMPESGTASFRLFSLPFRKIQKRWILSKATTKELSKSGAYDWMAKHLQLTFPT